MHYITREFSSEIMNRSGLRNNFLKKPKRRINQNLDEKNNIDNRKSDYLNEKTLWIWIWNGREFKYSKETSSFFSNTVKKFETPQFDSNDSGNENINDPVLKATLKYKNHESILAIKKYSKNKLFHFEEVKIGKIEKENLKLDKTNAYPKIEILTRIIDIFAEFLCTSINVEIKSASFPSSLKLADVTILHKYGEKIWKIILG